MVKNIRHSGIVVRDIIESYNFYVDLGFMIESDEIEKGKFLDTILGIDGCEIRVMKMSCDNQMIELLDYIKPKSKDFEKRMMSKLTRDTDTSFRNLQRTKTKMRENWITDVYNHAKTLVISGMVDKPYKEYKTDTDKGSIYDELHWTAK